MTSHDVQKLIEQIYDENVPLLDIVMGVKKLHWQLLQTEKALALACQNKGCSQEINPDFWLNLAKSKENYDNS
jgi:hypothetical protein